MASLAQRTMLQSSDSALLSDTSVCVDDQVAKVCCPMRKHPPDVGRLVFGQPAASASDSPSIVTMPSCCSGTSHTARGVWSKYRPIRFRRVKSARVAFRLRDCIPYKRMRCLVGLMPDMPVSFTRCGRFSVRPAPILRGQVVHSTWRRRSSSVDAPP